MAIDTRRKRGSVLALDLPDPPDPDGSIGQDSRAFVGEVYAGFAVGISLRSTQTIEAFVATAIGAVPITAAADAAFAAFTSVATLEGPARSVTADLVIPDFTSVGTAAVTVTMSAAAVMGNFTLAAHMPITRPFKYVIRGRSSTVTMRGRASNVVIKVRA